MDAPGFYPKLNTLLTKTSPQAVFDYLQWLYLSAYVKDLDAQTLVEKLIGTCPQQVELFIKEYVDPLLKKLNK